MDQVWWSQIDKANCIIRSVADSVLENKSVVFQVPRFVPWRETMVEMIENELHSANGEKLLKYLEPPEGTNAGEYLMNRFCSEAKRATYRRGKSYAEFLAESTDIVLHDRYVWIRGLNEADLKEWNRFIVEYNRHLPPYMSGAVFILEVEEGTRGARACKGMTEISFDGSIDPYDKFTFAALASAQVSVKQRLRPYFAELVSRICSDDIELCGSCIRHGKEFMEDPVKVLEHLIRTERRSDGTPYRMQLENAGIGRKIWESQIRQIYPEIEKYRLWFVRKKRKEIEKELPMADAFGEVIDRAEDVELGQLIRLAGQKKLILDNRQYEELDLYRKARNSLSHLDILELSTVEKILNARIPEEI